MGELANALFAVVTKTLENAQTFGHLSKQGKSSEQFAGFALGYASM